MATHTSTTIHNDHCDHSVHHTTNDHCVTNIDNRVVTHNHTTNIIPFGEEDWEFTLERAFKKTMMKCLTQPVDGIERLVTAMHFSKDRPESQNVCIPNVSRAHALCWCRGENGDNDGWMLQDKTEVLTKLFEACASVMVSFTMGDAGEDVLNSLPPRVRRALDEFERQRDEDDPEMMASAQKKAERAVLNNQDRLGVRQRARTQQRAAS